MQPHAGFVMHALIVRGGLANVEVAAVDAPHLVLAPETPRATRRAVFGAENQRLTIWPASLGAEFL
jgi:hypothetical protein